MHNNSQFYDSVNSELKEILDHHVPEILLKENRQLISKLEQKIKENNLDIDEESKNIGKKIVLNSILKKSETHIIEAFHKEKNYDHKFSYKNKNFTIKVKIDLQVQQTGNIVFKLSDQDVSADYFYYVLPGIENEILIFDRIKLSNFIKESKKDTLSVKYTEIIQNWKLGEILLRKLKA